MKIISWNVNGLRACINKGFLNFLESSNADIYCIQETKMQKEQNGCDFQSLGFYESWNSAVKKGYSGTLILSKKKPLNVQYGIGIEEHDNEGRVIVNEYNDFYLVNVYTPNAQQGLARIEYRIKWEGAFRDFLKNLDFKKPVIICGDLNVAHNEIDLKNPSANRKNAGFSDEERREFGILLESGFIDTFRFLYPNKQDAYTWWSYMRNARDNNIGWRIDYFLISQKLKENLIDSIIYSEILGSDHCPVGIDIKTK